MKIGYARVSTADQDLAAQIDTLTKAGCERLWTEKISGARSDRAQLADMLSFVKAGDMVVVTGIDRLARSSRDLHNILHEIEQRGAQFKSLRETWADTSSPQGRLFIAILAAIAEMERELIRARTGEGRKRAMAAGVKFGRKPYALTDEQKAAIRARLAAGEKKLPLAEEYGVSRDTIRKLEATFG